MSDRKSLAIIGAGLSGIALFVHMARLLQATGVPLDIHIFNRDRNFARGVAYGTQSASHLLNVPAGRMSLLNDAPGDFLAFLADEGLPADPVSFVPRSYYGSYLRKRFEDALVQLPAPVRVFQRTVEVQDARPNLTGGGFHLMLADGSFQSVDRLVLSTGNFSPVWPAVFDSVPQAAKARLIDDPWSWLSQGDALPGAQRVLMVGTGLTMLDVALELKARAFAGSMLAMSRHGYVPQAHRGHAVSVNALTQIPEGLKSPRQWLAYLRRFPQSHPGADWRDAIAGIRAITPRIWASWSDRSRTQFLRHLRSLWDVHRHRCAPFIDRQVQQLCAQGQLSIVGARIREVKHTDDGLVVSWVDRNGQPGSGTFDRVINCTGPSMSIGPMAPVLFRRLVDRGLLRVDRLQLGVEVSDSYETAAGAGVHYIGPMLRARFWEATAVPELRGHAERLAVFLCHWVG